MKKTIIIIVIGLLVLDLIIGAGYLLFFRDSVPLSLPESATQFDLFNRSDSDAGLTASGFIEHNPSKIAAEYGGRITAIAADKGDAVSIGQELVVLDNGLIQAQLAQIEAEIALAEAQLAQLEAGVPAETIAVAEAAVAMAEAERDAAYQTWQDTILLRDNPQELNAQIDVARSQIKITELQAEQTVYYREIADLQEGLNKQYWDVSQEGTDIRVQIPGFGSKTFFVEFPEGEKQQASVAWNLASMNTWQAWVGSDMAESAHNASQRNLQTLLDLRDNPLQEKARVTQAEANYQAKVSAVDVAKANLALAQTGPTAEQISVLESKVIQAKSQLVSLAAQNKRFTLLSPVEGVVVERVAHEGEVALPGTALLTVANPNNVTLTVYAPESDYGRLRLGQSVAVYVDSYPGQAFEGSITHIGDQAEFTPKNVQTKEERASTVYAIKITIPNQEQLLKPGMPADAVFE